MTGDILLIDTGWYLADLLQRCLAGSGFVVHLTNKGEEGLENIVAPLNLKAAFVTVELPYKKGFSNFAKLKRLASKIPMVIVTSSLEPYELQMHAKLRGHADFYLDTRTLTGEEFVHVLKESIGLELDPSILDDEETVPNGDALDAGRQEPIVVHDAVQEGNEVVTSDRGDSEGGETKAKVTPTQEEFDSELADLIAGEGDDHPADHDEAEPIDSEGTSEESQNTEDVNLEILRLKKELEEARRNAINSPFSGEFSKLRESTRRKDKEMIRLKHEMMSLARELSNYKNDREILDTRTRERDEALAKTSDLEQRLALLQLDDEELRRQLEETKRVHSSEKAELALELEETRNAAQKSREDYETQINELESSKEDLKIQALQTRLSALNDVEERLQKEKEVALDSLKAKHEEELEGARRRHAESLADLEDKLRNELESSKRSNEDDLAEKKRECEELRDSQEKLRAELAAMEERLSESEKRHQAVQTELGETHRSELERQEQAHEKATAEKDREIEELRRTCREQETKMRRLDSQQQGKEERWRSELEDLESEKREINEKSERRLKEVHEKYKSMLGILEEDVKEAQSAKEELEKRMAAESQNAAKALSQEKSLHEETKRAYEAKLTELQSEQDKATKEAELRSRNQLADLEVQQREEKERVAKEAEASWKEKLEAAEREHSDTLASLKTKYEEQIEALETARRATTSLAVQASSQQIHEENENLRDKIRQMEEVIAANEDEISRRNRIMGNYERTIAGRDEVINSLKAVIEDFYRSAEAHAQDHAHQEETISSLKAVIEDFYRSTDTAGKVGEEEPIPR